MEFVATCLFGLEKLLGEELDALGVKRTETIDGRVTFEGTLYDIAKVNVGSRFAERIYIKMGQVFTNTSNPFDTLFEGVKAMPFEGYIGSNDTFVVTGHSVKSKLTSIPALQRVVQKAIASRLGEKYGKSWFDGDGVRYSVEFFILNDLATLMIDTSGMALHKRGYRANSNDAPLRETLAAALCKLARPREDVLFWDPMCGSGTIPIEAAMIVSNTAPGLRRSFAAEKFPFLPENAFRQARGEAIAAIRQDCAFEAYASDIDPACVQLTRDNIAKAGMGKYVKCFERNALEITTGGRRGTIVCNPPYGERLLTPEECAKLYRRMGAHFATLDSWRIYIISSNEQFERLYGRRADKVRKLYNGMLRCGYYQYFKKRDDQDGEKRPFEKPYKHYSNK
ncbi:MAG: class I SAM-dependent RNA methyltransferase [Clostridia bacterium]|nr:class I SAM-dependent RNA methyltransferase [Clostridia bacterium]